MFNPTPESFNRFTSAFVVYLRFREALKNLFEDTVTRLNFCAEQEAQLEENIRQVEGEYNNFKRLKDEYALDLETSVNDREHLEQLLLQAKNVFNEHKEEKAKIDAEIERTKIAINDVQLNRTKVRHINENLSEQIVDDPEVIYNQKNELEAHKATQTTTLKCMIERLEAVKQRLNRLEGCHDFLIALKEKLTQHLEEVLRPLVENVSAAKTIKTRNETLREQIKHQKNKREEAQKSLVLARQDHEEKLRLAEQNAENKLKLARKFADETHEQVQQIQRHISQENKKIELIQQEYTRREDTMTNTYRTLQGNLKKVSDAAKAYSQSMDDIMKELHKTVAETK